jgi:hypothetical protein
MKKTRGRKDYSHCGYEYIHVTNKEGKPLIKIGISDSKIPV